MMRNPDNQVVPNLYCESREGAMQWMGKAELMGLKPFMDDPLSHIDKGMSRPAAMFLKQELGRYNKIMNSKEGRENEC